MDDHAFPGQHTTTTVVTTNTEVITSLRFDAEHLNTIHGKLKIAELVCLHLLQRARYKRLNNPLNPIFKKLLLVHYVY